MSDIIVMDKADEAITFAGSAVTDVDGLLGGVPELIEDVVELVEDLLDHLTVSVLPSDLDLDTGELLDLDTSLEHVLGLVPGLVGGTLTGGAAHADGTADVVVDHGLGITTLLDPILEPVAEIVTQIGLTLGVTDELPARLAALGGLTMVGSDAVLSNLPDILDSALGLGGLSLGETVDDLLTTVGGLVDDVTVSLGLGSILDIVDVGLTDGPTTLEVTTDESAGAGHGLVDSLFGDAVDLGDEHPRGTLLVPLAGLLHSAPAHAGSTVDVILTDTVDVTVPEALTHTTVGVGNLLDEDPTTVGASLGADVDHTLNSVTAFTDDTVTGLGVSLDLGGGLG
jgi:hypothetical protein